MKAKFGIGFGRFFTLQESAQYAGVAEEYGFDHATVLDHQFLSRNAYIALSMMALKTSKIKLATGVTNPYTRHPTVTANLAATLAELSNGRFILGIGAGFGSTNTMGVPMKGRMNELKKHVSQVRALLSGQEVDYDGHKVRFPDWALRKVPIYVATTGPKSHQVAGEIGDGVYMAIASHAPMINHAIENIKIGAKRAGRKFDEVDVWLRVPLCIDKDPNIARNKIRSYVSTYGKQMFLSFQNALDEIKGVVPYKEFIDDLRALHGAYKYLDTYLPNVGHAKVTPDRLVDTVAIVGTPAQCVNKIEAIAKETGINKIAAGMYTVESPGDRDAYLKTVRDELISRF